MSSAHPVRQHVRPSSARPAKMGIAVVGFGYMGRVHLAAYEAAQRGGVNCEVIALCDRHSDRVTSEAGNRVRYVTADFERLLADPAILALSICTHTDSHVEFTKRALRAKKHVLLEKPVANSAAEAAELCALEQRSKATCMPAHCMRFWPGWRWLHHAIQSGVFGRVQSATFERLSAPPAWAPHFYGDFARSGGALWDLHLHDLDFLLWCFGEPTRVVATGNLLHVTALYRFGSGPSHVTAEAAWDQAPGFDFRLRYLINFEHATADFDSRRSAPLLLHQAGQSEAVPLEPQTGYELMVLEFLAAIAEQRAPSVALADARRVATWLETEQRSLSSLEWLGV